MCNEKEVDSYDVIVAIRPYLPNCKILSITEVGSGMWGMKSKVMTSDRDLIVIYQEKTKDILSGRRIHDTLPCKHHIMIDDQEYDFSYLEIGHFCNQLKKGNINMIWALISPIIIYHDPKMKVLKDVIKSVHTADIIPSGIGMTESQLRDVTKRAEQRSPEKSLKTAYRTINFILNHIKDGVWKFEPCFQDVTESDVRDIIDSVRTFSLNKEYQHMPINLIEEWLYTIRVID